MANLVEIKALFFALVGGSAGAEGVLLNQNLAVRPTSIFRDFHADFLGTLSHPLLDLVHETRYRLRLVKFDDNALDRIGTRTDPACGSEAGASICSTGWAGCSDE